MSHNSTSPIFDHEKLAVYQRALDMIEWLDPLLESLPKSIAAHNQLDRASTSAALNIAEGNGKYSKADRFRYFDIARGSTLECAACLDVLVRKKKCSPEIANQGKEILREVVSMLVGLLKYCGEGRLREEEGEYRVNGNALDTEDSRV
ncbi:MAG: four helix bundle protein [Roseimicrobium sp.]